MTYLLGLRMRDRDVLVVGGGRVAQRRVPVLLEAGARVTLVSPEVSAALEDLADAGRLTWVRRPFEPGDVVGPDAPAYWLVHAATDSAEVNAAVATEAEDSRIWCVRADDRHASSAWTPASGRSGGITVGVVASGDPKRSAGLRDAIIDGLAEGALDARRGRERLNGVALVGGGPGDPGLITVRGRRLLSQADVVVVDRLAPTSLLDALPSDVEIVDAAKIPSGRSMTQDEINSVLVERAKEGKFVVRLKGGDSFLFGRGGEEAAACAAAGVPVIAVPGVTSALAAPTGAGIPTTHRGVAHRLRACGPGRRALDRRLGRPGPFQRYDRRSHGSGTDRGDRRGADLERSSRGHPRRRGPGSDTAIATNRGRYAGGHRSHGSIGRNAAPRGGDHRRSGPNSAGT